MPPKPGKQGKWRQQWVSIRCKATKAGLKVAEAKAAKLESDLLLDRFDWDDWLKNTTSQNTTNKTAHEWVEAFLAWKGESVKDTTIRNDYQPYTQLVDCQQTIRAALLTEACRQGATPNSRAQKAYVRCLKTLALADQK